jgi:hypothetical protein
MEQTMASKAQASGWRRSPWRLVVWGIPTFLLLLPAVAMRFTAEVDWSPSDFVIMGILLYGTAGLFELAARASTSLAYRGGVGLTVVTAFLLIWINLAVGIIGDEGDPPNLMYAVVLGLACGGATLAHFRAAGMAWALFAAGAAQASIGVIALALGLGANEPPGPLGILILNSIFTGLWLLAALLFRQAAKPIAG